MAKSLYKHNQKQGKDVHMKTSAKAFFAAFEVARETLSIEQ